MRATTPLGYHGRALWIDVSQGTSREWPLSTELLRRRLGGSGLGTELLLQAGAASHDPLSASAVLAIVFSPLVGSPLTTSAKFAIVCKSPLTDRLNDSLSSSRFALSGKQTGYDAILIQGRAPQPSLLFIDEQRCWLEPAGDVWGLTHSQTLHTLQQRYGTEWSVLSVGPAGERLVRMATLSHAGRHAGRGGAGAVLGAKQIKAVLVRGQRRVTWADPTGLIEYARALSHRSLGPATAKYREVGTIANLSAFNRLRMLPTRNFQQGSFAEASQLSEKAWTEHRRGRGSCAACTIGCEHWFAVPPTQSSSETETATSNEPVKLEYETLFALGPLCGVADRQAILQAAQWCDEMGVDTISAGATLAFAMECAERGWLESQTLRFGSAESLLQNLRALVRREGIGDWLAEGSRRLAARLGPQACALAPHVKGLELPGYDPRGVHTLALGLAVNPRGADHNRSSAYEVDFSPGNDRHRLDEAQIQRAIEVENKAALMDSLILCKFLRGVFSDLYAEAAHMLHLITGWDVTSEELRRTSAEIIDAKKRFNIRAGWTPEEDTLPERFFTQALPDDPQARLSRDEFQLMVQRYYALRGWTASGRLADEPPPTQASALP
ncbi:MAG: aldehyde ferredoxin oxidoreductase [Planctomycetaceae bacterium]|nr:MAG: aldehyde ferredoxin oxidoreductase [Planctomycetaceae bacterium]